MSRKTIFLVFALIFFYSVTSLAQSLDNAFDNAMKFGVFPRRPHFDAFWNPAKMALSPGREIGFFSVQFPYLSMDISLNGLGAGFTTRKNTFVYFTDRLKIDFADTMFSYHLDEKTYRLGFARALNKNVAMGFSYKKVTGDELFDVSAFAGLGAVQKSSMQGNGMDLGLAVSLPPMLQVEYLFLDASTHIEQNNNNQTVPSTHVVQMDFFPLKGLALSSQAVFYKDDTLDDKDDFKAGAGYTFKNIFSARVVAGEAGRLSLYGASVFVKNISLNYDMWKYDIVGDNTQSFVSAVLKF